MPTNPNPRPRPPQRTDPATRPRPHGRVRVGLALGVAVFGLAAAAAACSGSSAATQAATDAGSPSTSASQASPPGSGGGNRQAYIDCLAQHGVTVPSRGANGGGNFGGDGGGGFGGNRGTGPSATDQATQDARNACASLRPAGGGQGGQAFQAYATCMRDNGVTMPTAGQGQTGTDSTGRRTRPTLDQSDPKVAAANGKCQQLLPNGGQGGGPAGTGRTGTGGATP